MKSTAKSTRVRPFVAALLLCCICPREARQEGDPLAIRSDPPDAWLIVLEYPDGVRCLDGIFDSKEHAEAALAKMNPTSLEGSPKGVVEKDAPDSKVRVDGVCILKPEHITVRNHWLERNRKWIVPLAGQAQDAVAFTWEEGPVDDPLAGRLGGPAPMRKGAAWPVCPHCKKPLTFYGAIDFRGTPERERVPGDTLTYFQCQDSLGGGTSCCAWLSKGDDIVLAEAPAASKGVPCHRGTRWKVTDYPFDIHSPMYEDKVMQGTVGHSPFFSVNAFATKIGGHVFWEQGDETPTCSCGKRMLFVGQFIGGCGLDLGDSGIAYLFQCPSGKCGKTRIVLQCM